MTGRDAVEVGLDLVPATERLATVEARQNEYSATEIHLYVSHRAMLSGPSSIHPQAWNSLVHFTLPLLLQSDPVSLSPSSFPYPKQENTY